MPRDIIQTNKAPVAIGTYSQAVRAGELLFISGQIPLNPETMEMISEDFEAQAIQAFNNLKAICDAAEASLEQVVKLNISLTNMENFALMNDVMHRFFSEPFPARAAVGVSQLPKNSLVEIEAIVSFA